MLTRSLEPELLDTLAPESPEAVHSRRDLGWFNRVMGNPAWLRRVLPTVASRGEAVLELGAGTGEVGLGLAGLGFVWCGLDRVGRPPAWPAAWAWHQSDLRQFDGWAPYPVVVGNLIFHHLSDAELAALGRQLDRHARVIVACETTRQRRWQGLFRALCWLIRAHPVSRHDGHVSIAAGFRGQELPELLGLARERWTWSVHVSLRGVYRLVARRTVP